jgi:hypothetical protein
MRCGLGKTGSLGQGGCRRRKRGIYIGGCARTTGKVQHPDLSVVAFLCPVYAVPVETSAELALELLHELPSRGVSVVGAGRFVEVVLVDVGPGAGSVVGGRHGEILVKRSDEQRC